MVICTGGMSKKCGTAVPHLNQFCRPMYKSNLLTHLTWFNLHNLADFLGIARSWHRLVLVES